MKLFLIFFFILLNGCSSTVVKTKVDTYNSAMILLKTGNYKQAGEVFEKLEDSQPFTTEATNGLVMSAYSYYKAKQYDDSIRVINYFTQSNPINDNLSYMYYLKGLNYYNMMKSMNKAREIIESANTSFLESLNKFPNSIYQKDIQNRLKKVETYLSGNELNIANYYFKRKNYIGAINHFSNIISNYPNSNFTAESLYRLVEINLILNIKLEAIQYYQLLAENYNTTIWKNYATTLIQKYDTK